MPERNLDQRLVAILAADVAGYYRLMEADENSSGVRPVYLYIDTAPSRDLLENVICE